MAGAARPTTRKLRIDPLPPESAMAVLGALLGDDHALLPLKDLLIARTEGTPFFLEESVRTLVEMDVLAGERGNYRLAKPIESIQVPASVQAVLAARIDRLALEAKQSTSVRFGYRQRFPVCLASGRRRTIGRKPQTRARSSPSGGIYLRDTPVSRPRIHFQARSDS